MEKFRKYFSLFLIAMYVFTSPATFVFAKEINKKSQAKSTVSVGKLENNGDIKVTKTVTPTDTVGKYTVTFEVEGKPAEEQTSSPIYAAVVFDRSGSMICDASKEGYSYLFDTYNNWPNNSHDADNMYSFDQDSYFDYWSYSTKYVTRVTTPTYTAADNSKILCGEPHESIFGMSGSWGTGEYFEQKDNTLISNKWESAIQGAIDFTTTLKSQVGSNANFSLVTFSTNASTATAFSNNAFNSSDFGTPTGGTNLAAALNNANSALSSAPKNAKKVILVISDGEPDSKNAAQNAANNISKDVEIYAIGYSTTNDAKNFLKNKIASKTDNYSDADPETVSAKMKELAMSINHFAAGSNVELSDSLTGEFSFNQTDFTTDKDTKFELKDIASDDNSLKQTVSFDIYINTELPTGIYDTNDIANDKVKLTYTDYKGEQKELVFDESPSVEWVQPTYTVNYYKDSITDSNKIGDSVVKDGIYNKNVSLTETELNLRKPKGYKVQDNQVSSILIDKDSSKNVINVVYVKGNFNYSLKYYKDSVEDSNKIGDDDVRTATFEDVVTVNYNDKNARVPLGYRFDSINPESLVISDDESKNIFEILYVKDNFDYTVNYYKDSITNSNKLGDSVSKSAKFESKISLSDDDKNLRKPNGYKLDSVNPDNLVVTSDASKNVINVLYVKDNFDYTVNYYKDSIDDSNKLGDSVSKSAKFESKISLSDDDKNLRKPDGYKLDSVNPDNLVITSDASKNVINVLYVKDDFNYSLRYYKDSTIDTNKIGNDDVRTATFEDIVTVNYNDKNARVPLGYRFESITPETLTISSNENKNIFNILYVRDNFDYVVNYYKDSIDDSNHLGSYGGIGVFEDTITLTEDDLNEMMPDGYTLQDNQPISLKITADPFDNVINIVYVKRNDLSYRVEYYFDGNIDENLTIVKYNQEFGKQINEYDDKVKDGYKFDRVENLPLTITTGDNVIKVYYVNANTSKEEAVAIPKTSVMVSGSSDLFILLSLLFVLYLRGRKIFE